MGAVVWAEQLCRAVCFLHRHRIIHRDIKPDNITIDEETHQLTLVDLSAAEYIPEGSSFIIGAEGDGAPGAAVGTSGWVHPVIEGWLDTGSGESYDERKVDMWAIGRVLGGYVAEQEYVGQGSRMILRWYVKDRVLKVTEFGGELMLDTCAAVRWQGFTCDIRMPFSRELH
ncbi:kinase-like domain-containing protein [Pterulicium gracile]|uniref:Kinase-like domain-containing protein n=1 Tax=Pterulicium gracile TaxID=1884261 RepID=A0A5C3Q887_9AGAR|nr:kinase-like domain-containing protein [Pterula gracilis]